MACGDSRAGPARTRAESLATLEQAVGLGCNFFDTAWAYGDGRSEQILGRLLKNHPDKNAASGTKTPPKNRQWPLRRGFTLDDCFPPEYIREYTEKSLENLGVVTIDLQQFHVWEHVLGALTDAGTAPSTT